MECTPLFDRGQNTIKAPLNAKVNFKHSIASGIESLNIKLKPKYLSGLRNVTRERKQV